MVGSEPQERKFIMSDEFSRRLEDAANAHGRAAAGDVDVSVIAASVVGKARRRRRVTGFVTVAGAFVGVAVFAGGSLAVVNSMRDGANPATQLDASAVDMSQAPTVPTTESPSPAPMAAIQDYPPVAESRGDGFPDAYEMRDWVWDYVGEGWSLESYSGFATPLLDQPVTMPQAVVYLVSPGGPAFEIVALAPEYSSGLNVVSWQEDSHAAHIEWAGDNWRSPAVSGGAAELDLDTGVVSPIVFSTPWGLSGTVRPVAISASGNELWQAYLGTHERFYRFGPAEGWTVASVNDLAGIEDRDGDARWGLTEGEPGAGLATRGDGAAVAFERIERGQSGNHFPALVAVYDVDADIYVMGPNQPGITSGPADDCYFLGWVGEDSLSYGCQTGDGPHVVTLPDAPALGVVSSFEPERSATGVSGTILPVLSGRVGYREAPSQAFSSS